MKLLLAVAAGGAIGASARYLLGVAIGRYIGHGFPWATLTVNMIGALAMGFLVAAFALAWSPGRTVQAFLTVGLLGGLTTFSAFSLDVVTLFERGQLFAAGIYVAASVILCVAFVFAGMAAARALFA
ncbi:MAG: fluoride efflux transporter CrcB [Pseudomonadota bacterium]